MLRCKQSKGLVSSGTHILQRKIPYLFETPGKLDVSLGLMASAALAIFSVFWIVLGSSSDRGWYYMLAATAAASHLYIMIKHGRNILFLFRYGLLFVIGLGAAVAWSFDDSILIAPFGAHYQTHDATVALVGSVLLALAGTGVGWFIAFRRPLNTSGGNTRLSSSHLAEVRFISIVLIYLTVAIFVYRAGGLVGGEKTYASGGNDIGVEFGALNAVLFTFSALFLISSYLLDKKLLYSALILLSAYLFPILAGSRADFLMQFSILAFVFAMSYQMNSRQKRRYPVFIIIAGVALLYIASNFIGAWRSVGDFGAALTVFRQEFSIFSERPSGTILTLSTANQMTGHFYAVHAKLNFLNESFLMGSSYVDFLLRTPPGFLGLPRPTDLAWEMNVAGETMAQGGIFEVAEAYWNFWYFGAFLIPLVITRCLAWLLCKGVSYGKHWFYFGAGFMAISLMAPRGVWYQTFAYWRVMTVFVAMAIIVYTVTHISAPQGPRITRGRTLNS